jgi:hypothetical protein
MARGNPVAKHSEHKGMGFEAAAENAAAGEGESLANGKAIIAASARKASAGAKKANPNLKKVKG